MSHHNNRKHSMCVQKYTLVLLICQGFYIVPSEAFPQNGFPFGLLQPIPFIGNIIQGAEKTIQNLLPDPLRAQQNPRIIATTTTTTTHAPDLIGGFFNAFGNLFGGGQTTTTTTTLHPPPRGGRDINGVIYNIVIIINDFFDILNNVLLLNDDWVPGYIGKKLADMFESIKAEIDIFTQINEPGGLGEIPKRFSEVWNDISEILKLVTSGDVGNMLGLPLLGAKILQDIGKLNGEFAFRFPTITLPPDVKPLANERIKLNEQEYENILNHTESLMKNLLRIEEIIQTEFPNSTILKTVGYFRGSFIKALQDSRRTGKPIVLNTIQTMFPNELLSDYIAEFGKFLSQNFQNIQPIQMLGNILQQKFIVSIGLNVVQAFFSPFFENVERFIEAFMKDIVSRYLVLDPDHFIVHLIDTFSDRFESFGNYLEDFQNLKGKVKLNFTEGDVFQQLINITRDILTSKETFEFINETVAQILKIIPLDFGEDAVHGVTSVITDVISGFIRLLSRGVQFLFPESPIQNTHVMNVTTLNPNSR